jgi:hypothetical protein
MSGFLERLALRGAGLAPPGAPVAMRLRPRGRFEPGPGASPPAEDIVDTWVATRPSSFLAAAEQGIAPGLARPPERSGDPTTERSAQAEQVPPPIQPQGQLHAPLPVDGSASQETAATKRGLSPPPPDRILSREEATVVTSDADPARAPASVASAAVTGETRTDTATASAAFAAVAGEAPTDTAGVAAAAAPLRDGPRPTMPVQWRSERPARPEDHPRAGPAPPAALPQRPRPDPVPAPVTLSIGRIDVEFVQPPAPPAVAAPAVNRSRGFSNYARARRGSPR